MLQLPVAIMFEALWDLSGLRVNLATKAGDFSSLSQPLPAKPWKQQQGFINVAIREVIQVRNFVLYQDFE